MTKLTFLRDRALMLQRARSFFASRDILEVDCPALSLAAPVDLHIEVMKVDLGAGQIGYLHTSAEYGMKRLLAQGIGDIYQISHVFRLGEVGALHNPEFTMAEWYRCGFSLKEMIPETLDFIRLFLGDLPSKELSYKEAFERYLNIDYTRQTQEQLLSLAKQQGITLSAQAHQWDKDTLLQLLMSLKIEPLLGNDHLLILFDFPASQSALAQIRTCSNNQSVASRFEVYFHGIELANGYHELTDPIEQELRFKQINAARAQAGKEPLKIDEKFLLALGKGLPDCSGVAVGFDRLMLLRHKQHSLNAVLTFSWQEV